MKAFFLTYFGILISNNTNKKRQSKDCLFLSQWRDSNPRPADYKSAALAS
jgi:hypothetical protein